MIYFAALGDEVKIGYSVRPRRRVRQIRSELHGGPIQLLGTIEGDVSIEHALHKHFAAFHLRGEWFQLSSEISSFIEYIKAKPNLRLLPSIVEFQLSVTMTGIALSDAIKEFFEENRKLILAQRAFLERATAFVEKMEQIALLDRFESVLSRLEAKQGVSSSS